MARNRTPRLYTYEEFAELPDEIGRCELIDGELYMTPSPAGKHQIIGSNLVRVFRDAIDQPAEGLILYEFDVVFTKSRAVRPDVIFISRSNMHRYSDRCMGGAPDLIVEILSPGNEGHDRVLKLDWYKRYGVEEYWLVHSDRQRVLVYRRVGEGFGPVQVFESGDALTTPLMPRLSCKVEALYSGLPS